MIQQSRRRYMHLNVHNSTIYNSQDMEATYMSIDRWMDKEDMVRIYNRILLSHKKEWNSAICSNMDGPRDDHTKWSKSDRERQISHDITYVWNLKYYTNELIYKQKESAASVAAFQQGNRESLLLPYFVIRGVGVQSSRVSTKIKADGRCWLMRHWASCYWGWPKRLITAERLESQGQNHCCLHPHSRSTSQPPFHSFSNIHWAPNTVFPGEIERIRHIPCS